MNPILTFFRAQIRSRIAVCIWHQDGDPPDLWRGTVVARGRLVYSTHGDTYERTARSCSRERASEIARLEAQCQAFP